MKKFLSIVLCISLILQNFIFAIPVQAVDDSEKIVIDSFKQNGKELKVIDGVYQVEDTCLLENYFHIENYKKDRVYMLMAKINGQQTFGHSLSALSEQQIDYVYLDSTKKDTVLTYELQDANTNEVLDTINLSFLVTKYEEYNLGNIKLYLEKITQGGKEITLDENNNYTFNNNQDIIIDIKGENFINDVVYPIYIYGLFYPIQTYTGKELNDGITLKRPIIDLDSKGFSIAVKYDVFFADSASANPKACKDSEYCYFGTRFSDDIETTKYNVGLSYANYKDIVVNPLEKFESYYKNEYLVSNRYHNSENPLVVNITGEKYLDKDYDVEINVKKDNKNLYSKKVTVNGLLLNKGYDIILDNFTTPSDKDYFDDDEKNEINVDVTIDYITKTIKYMYGFSTNYSTIQSEIFFENGRKNLSTFRGDGNFYYNSGFADTNINAFKKYENVYFRYLGSYFEEDLTYEYEFSYNASSDYGGFENKEVLKTGTITGKELNSTGLTFAANNPKNYRFPAYALKVTYNGEMIYTCAPILDLVSYPTFANVVLTNANNKDLYLKMDDYSYVATRNFPISFAVSGIGFEEDRDYEIGYGVDLKYKDGHSSYGDLKYVTFSGKEINNGTAVINYNEEITDDIVSAYVYATYELDDGFGQGGFEISFVNSKDLFPDDNPYFVDNGKDLIKNIKDKTNVTDFIKEMKVNDNGSIKIYDKTGTIEQTNIVGTGMIARILDAYNNTILDLDVVVKGDVSGDGNISITDLVKTKQHIAEINILNGVYEVAGDVTSTGHISITDLVKLSQDVAGIKDVD